VCEPACGCETIEPACGCEVIEPACGCEDPCGPRCRGGLLHRLFHHRHHGAGCGCDVCEPACGC
jgi:hypothetical protein